MDKLTLGSLFDGSGGFPLGGLLCGIEPLWASEIEPFPIRVTTKRIPQMKHYGDISKLNGANLPPVDIITFGSPCTDMSVAGKRAGLDGEQSVLFYEAIRIIKEMRCKTNGRYPRYAVWENVPGAFSSNKGADFRAVLEAVIGVKNRAPQCLYLKKDDGLTQTCFWETDGAWLTELSMRNISEFPNAVVESTLSQILQAEVPEKYYLSPKACQGILRRAAARGKELPEMLRVALEDQAAA
jgi:hypothetical protein